MSSMQLLDGKVIAEELLAKLKKEVEGLRAQKIEPTAHIIVAGHDEVTQLYTHQKIKKADFVGIKFIINRLAEKTTTEKVIGLIEKLNQKKNVHGIIVQLPLPKELNTDKIIWAIAPHKDVDGFQMRNFRPPTPLGILELLAYYGLPIARKKVTIVGGGRLVGRPLSVIMHKRGAWVTMCDETTRNLKARVQSADIIVVAAGVPNLITADMVNDHQIVIDAGTTSENGVIKGDVVFDSVAPRVKAITPVPGGIGPLTVTELLKNIVKAAKEQVLT